MLRKTFSNGRTFNFSYQRKETIRTRIKKNKDPIGGLHFTMINHIKILTFGITIDFVTFLCTFRSKVDSSAAEEKTVQAEESLITLPISYDPVAMLDQVETRFNFTMKAAHSKMDHTNSNVSNVIVCFLCFKTEFNLGIA